MSTICGLAYEWVFSVLIVQPTDDSRQFCGCLRLCNSSLQAPNHNEHVAVQLLPPVGELFVVGGSPQLHALFGIREPRWHDSDDSIGFRIQMDGLIQHRRIAAEASLP